VFKELPRILTFHLLRFEFDQSTGIRVKAPSAAR
jgi:hypothetical protein